MMAEWALQHYMVRQSSLNRPTDDEVIGAHTVHLKLMEGDTDGKGLKNKLSGTQLVDTNTKRNISKHLP